MTGPTDTAVRAADAAARAARCRSARSACSRTSGSALLADTAAVLDEPGLAIL